MPKKAAAASGITTAEWAVTVIVAPALNLGCIENGAGVGSTTCQLHGNATEAQLKPRQLLPHVGRVGPMCLALALAVLGRRGQILNQHLRRCQGLHLHHPLRHHKPRLGVYQTHRLAAGTEQRQRQIDDARIADIHGEVGRQLRVRRRRCHLQDAGGHRHHVAGDAGVTASNGTYGNGQMQGRWLPRPPPRLPLSWHRRHKISVFLSPPNACPTLNWTR